MALLVQLSSNTTAPVWMPPCQMEWSNARNPQFSGTTENPFRKVFKVSLYHFFLSTTELSATFQMSVEDLQQTLIRHADKLAGLPQHCNGLNAIVSALAGTNVSAASSSHLICSNFLLNHFHVEVIQLPVTPIVHTPCFACVQA